MKTIVGVIAAILILAGTGCKKDLPPGTIEPSASEASVAANSSDLARREFQFQKKVECEKYIPGIKKELEGKAIFVPETGLQTVENFDQIFYSPLLNSCVYGTEEVDFLNGKRSGGFFLLYDALSGDLIQSSIYEWDKNYVTAMDGYEDTIRHYSTWDN
jgi:hypothetical protein